MKTKLNILYLGNKNDGSSPADRRRFLGFSGLSNNFNVYFDENSGVKFDVLVCCLGCDLIKALRLADSIPRVVLDYTNHYLVEESWIKDMLRNLAGSLINKKEFSLNSYNKTILSLMRKADLVICPSITQKLYLKNIGIDSSRLTDFFEKEVDFENVDFNGDGSMFWEGQGGNLKQLREISSVFSSNPSLLIRIVSDHKFGMLGGKLLKKSSYDYCKRFIPNLEFIDWSVSNVNLAARKSSLGIIPLDMADGFVVAKPENKLVFMWMLGLYTLCSPTESYSMLAKDTGVDFLCRNSDQWNNSIDDLLCNKKKRVEQAQYLHNYSRTEYSDTALLLKWRSAFEKANIL